MARPTTHQLDTLEGLLSLLKTLNSFPTGTLPTRGRMHCTTCARDMTMVVLTITAPPGLKGRGGFYAGVDKATLAPSLFIYQCVECGSFWTALAYAGPMGPSLAVFGQSLGGLSTPNTPPGVAYYLDQAHKAKAASANTAAVAMYRAAVEHLLFEQGYTERELGPKIARLEKAMVTGNAPAWAATFDVAFIRVLKELGNYSIHPNDGDISKQAVFDPPLLVQVEATMVEMLELVYEEPQRRSGRLDALQQAKAKLQQPPKKSTE